MAKRPDDFAGMDLTSPINRIRAGRAALAQNVRAYIRGGFKLRNRLSNAFFTIVGQVQTLARLNDTTPAGPPGGFTYISNNDTGAVFNNAVSVATGLTGNVVSMVPFRPNASVQPWMYIGDDSPYPSVTVAGGYNCTGMIKVRSDGLSRKMGIQEPQFAPVVATSGTTTPVSGTLSATSVPWTNAAGANPSFNYGQTTTPGTGGVGPPFIVALPAGSQTLELLVTGTATVNGVAHSPGDAGPVDASHPGNFTPAGPTIVLGAFTDGSGNVLTGASSVPILVNVGAGATMQVPAGAAQFQLGVNSSDAQFPANGGSFLVTGVLTVSAIATKLSTLGNVTAYVFGDSPHSGPVAAYIWKNPNDGGSGTPRTKGTAAVTTTNNSWQMDSTPENGTVPVQWDTLAPDGTVSGSIVLFSPALESEGYEDFNVCVVGSIFVPAAGTYTFTIQYKDQIMFGIGGGATAAYASGAAAASYSPKGVFGQSIAVVSSVPLLFVSDPDGEGTFKTTSLTVTFPGTGTYQMEIDWDYWFHTGRSLILTVNGAAIPPLPSGVRSNVSYAYKWRASETGAQSNPSPVSAPQLTPVLDNTVTPQFSPDPQVDKVDYYRQDAGLANFTYVATGPNTNPPTPIVDSLTDLEVANNQLMTFDDFEPVPSIDLPKSGTVTVSGGVITWVSGDKFNTRWLAGTVILIGSPTQIAYTFIARPTSTTSVTIPGVPDGTNLAYNISEPILAAQPLAYIFGPTDNINYAFGVGDPNRPGTLYWSKGSNLDSWPDTNQQDVTDPSEALVNGAMTNGIAILFSIKRAWKIIPNFFNALATITGTQGSTWTLQATGINRGLFIPRCLAVEGGGGIFFRVDDGIHYSPGGSESKSITDDDLYPLFVHEGSIPQPITRNGITVFPPDDSRPEEQKFQIINGYLYYDYVDTSDAPRTLVFDVAAMGFVLDTYSVPVTCRATNEGESIQGTRTGHADGTVRQLTTAGTETVAGIVLTPAIGGPGWMHAFEYTVEYSSNATVALTSIAADAGNGSYAPPAVTLPSTGGLPTKYTFKVGPNKWKWMQFQFLSTDPLLQVYLEGFIIQAKPWGSDGEYKPIAPFKPSGGHGGQG